MTFFCHNYVQLEVESIHSIVSYSKMMDFLRVRYTSLEILNPNFPHKAIQMLDRMMVSVDPIPLTVILLLVEDLAIHKKWDWPDYPFK